MSMMMSSSAHRSTWRRNRCPRPRFSLAPSMSPGMSARRSRGLPRTTSLNSMTPIWGCRVVKGYAAVLGWAFVMAFVSDDFPALGKPTRPTSAIDLRTRRNTPCSPTWPGLARLGARFVDVLKWVLPQPPLPPEDQSAIEAVERSAARPRPPRRRPGGSPRRSRPSQAAA